MDSVKNILPVEAPVHSPVQNEYDVVIVGGGLAGLALSIQLAKKGYKIVVLEKEQYPSNIKVAFFTKTATNNRRSVDSSLSFNSKR